MVADLETITVQDMSASLNSIRRVLVYLFLRLLAVMFGLLFAWLLLEIFLRVGFDLIPADAQGVIQQVRRVPWDEEPLVKPFPYIGSREHQARVAPGHDDYPVRWGDARFTFDTISLWEMPVGFRTDEPQWPVEIVAIGDSFTFCWTEVEDCWVQRLHSEYGWSVMNLGVPGTGAEAHLSLMEPYVRPLEPKIVIWQWYGNDYLDDYDFANIRGENLQLSGPPAYAPPPDFGKFAQYSAVYQLLRDWLYHQEHPKPQTSVVKTIGDHHLIFFNNLHSYDFQYESVQYGADQAFAAMQAAHEFVTNESGAEMVIVIIPSKEEVYAEHLTDFLDEAALDTLREGRLKLLEQCEANGWRCIDMTETFQQAVEEGDRVYWGFDFHLDPSGNQLVADTVAKYLIEQALLEDKR